MLQHFITESNYGLLNEFYVPTYIDHKNNTTSCLDLCFVSGTLLTVGSFQGGVDLGSDHFPIICSFKCNIEKDSGKIIKRWKYSTADWPKFQKQLEEQCSEMIGPLDAISHNMILTKSIYEAAESCIGKTSGDRVLRRYIPGWDQECRTVITERRKARNMLWTVPTTENLIKWKRARAKARYIMKIKKQEAFEDFVKTLNMNTPSKTVWEKIKSLGGSMRGRVNQKMGNPGEDKCTTANNIAKHFARFKCPPENEEHNRVIQDITNLRAEEIPSITLNELTAAIKRTKNTSPGEDEISNIMLKKLPSSTVDSLLDLYNTSLCSYTVPKSWKTGVVFPLLKPGGDPTSMKSLRPITMLSCIGKLMERIVQRRLEYHLETNNKLDGFQTGFRKGTGTTEALALIYKDINWALETRGFTIAIFLDIESAFDCVGHHALLYKMRELKTPSYLLKWFQDYLKNRTLKVRYDDITSAEKSLEAGVQQGSVLSPILFNIMMNDIPKDQEVKTTIYADDVTITSLGRTLEEAKANAQRYLNLFCTWLRKWNLNINPHKSSFQIYSSKRVIPDCQIKISNVNIKYVKEQKILGITFDCPKFTLNTHIMNLNNECRRRLQVIRALSSTKWGCNRNLLRRIYVAYIRSKIEYGSILFTDLHVNKISKLRVLQNDAMRSILGARKTSPIVSLEVETFLPPLEKRFKIMFVKWFVKVKRLPGYCDMLGLADMNNRGFFLRKMREISLEMGLPRVRSDEFPRVSPVEPWLNLSENIHIHLPFSTEQSSDNRVNFLFEELVTSKYADFVHIYTDGSKLQDGSVAAAIYIPHLKKMITYKLNPVCSVLSAELFAILKALEAVVKSNFTSEVVIFTDSQSSLHVISNTLRPSHVAITLGIQKIMSTHRVQLQWVKAHCGIEGNEVVDRAANRGHSNIFSTNCIITTEDVLHDFNKYFIDYWQRSWRHEVRISGKGSFMEENVDKIKSNHWVNIKSRKLEISIARLRIGHVGLKSHLHRFEMSESPLCDNCTQLETIQHF